MKSKRKYLEDVVTVKRLITSIVAVQINRRANILSVRNIKNNTRLKVRNEINI